MRLDELPRSDKVEDRRGEGPGGFPMGRAGGVGIGTIILLVIVGWALGINPLYLIGGAEILSGLRGSQQESQPAPGNAKTESASDQMSEFVSAVLGSTEAQWKEIFAQAGRTYEGPTLVMFSGATRSGCGFAQSATGPFYCPNDRKVYLDTAFFQDLERRFRGCDVGSKSCQFSQAYVITHEIGHHVQNFARNSAPGAGSAAQHGLGRKQSTAGTSRVAGRLPCRGVGAPRGGEVALH